MSALYRPVLIESAEQAKAFPAETVAIRDGKFPRILIVDSMTGMHWLKGTRAPGYVHSVDMVGWTALVPIEAEEEHGARGDGEAEDFYLARRFATPWEAAL